MRTKAAITIAALFGALCLWPMPMAFAGDVIVVDADTLIVNGTPYRLDGVDTPNTDQRCLDDKTAIWACGIEARDRLQAHLGGRDVSCDDAGRDSLYRKRRLATCRIEGETASLNQWLVREGWALNLEPAARGRFKADERDARRAGSGLWKGCFVAPQIMRRWKKQMAKLMGNACPADDDWELLGKLFPDSPVMPEGCTIKAKLADRASVTGHRGIYHLEGCIGYARLKAPDRWFCSEREAQAEGYRKALTCRKSSERGTVAGAVSGQKPVPVGGP